MHDFFLLEGLNIIFSIVPGILITRYREINFFHQGWNTNLQPQEGRISWALESYGRGLTELSMLLYSRLEEEYIPGHKGKRHRWNLEGSTCRLPYALSFLWEELTPPPVIKMHQRVCVMFCPGKPLRDSATKVLLGAGNMGTLCFMCAKISDPRKESRCSI